MKNLVFIYFAVNSLIAGAQNLSVREMNLTEETVEFEYYGTNTLPDSFLRYYEGAKSFFIRNNKKIFITPFDSILSDSLMRTPFLEYIKKNYNYVNAVDRYNYSSVVEVMNVVLEVDTSGKVVNYGLVHESNKKEFEKEILKIFSNKGVSFVLPVFTHENKAYGYIQTYHFTNYDLY